MKKLIYLFSILIVSISCDSSKQEKKSNFLKTKHQNIFVVKSKVDNIKTIELNGQYTLVLCNKKSNKITLKSKYGIGDSILISNKNWQYSIDINPKYNSIKQTDVIVYLPSKELFSICFNGKGSIVSDKKLIKNDLKLELNGKVNVNLNVELSEIKIDQTGDGMVSIYGKSKKSIVESEGIGEINLTELKSEILRLDNFSIGKISVYASKKIIIDNIGDGIIDYYGNPRERDLNNEGNGSIIKK